MPEAEAVLTTAGALTPKALVDALEALTRHVTAAGADKYTVQCAEGLLFSALAPHVDRVCFISSVCTGMRLHGCGFLCNLLQPRAHLLSERCNPPHVLQGSQS